MPNSDNPEEHTQRVSTESIAHQIICLRNISKLLAKTEKDIQDLKNQIKYLKRKNTLLGKKLNGIKRKISEK